MKNKLFPATFVVSLAFHALALLPLPSFSIVKEYPAVPPSLSYYQNESFSTVISQKSERTDTAAKPIRVQSPVRFRSTPTRTVKADRIVTGVPEKVKEEKKVVLRKPEAKTAAAASSIEKIYTSYYKLINEQLRRAIINPPYFASGEVAVSFIISADGRLQNVKVVNESSPETSFLRETAVRIINNASPFPPFPDDLQRQQLTFNIVICFKD